MSDQQNDKDFPGYPHQPKGEDITQNEREISIDAIKDRQVNDADNQLRKDTSDTKSASDVTKQDIDMLSAADQNRDMDQRDLEEPILDTTDNEGAPLNEPMGSYGKTGADLDVPGSELDNADEKIGEEDEENNYYSLGGDNHEDLEEDNTGR